jgi:hypothetical protein
VPDLAGRDLDNQQIEHRSLPNCEHPAICTAMSENGSNQGVIGSLLGT